MLTLLSTHALHLGARLVLRFLRPRVAITVVRQCGARLRPLDEGRSLLAARSLRRCGTCLSRSVTVASRLPGSEVAIGVGRDDNGVFAHAWVEVGGRPLSELDVMGEVIARL